MYSRLILLLSFLIPLVYASSGDRLAPFRTCLDPCVALCHSPPSEQPLFSWSCHDNCAYTCTQYTSDVLDAASLRAHQFYGKWPFIRIASLQEPASVLFSLANLVPHLRWAYTWSHPKYPRKYFIVALLGINAWLCSAIFHARDRWYTERLDYLGAQILLGYQLYFSISRILKLIIPASSSFYGPLRVASPLLIASFWITGASRAGIFSNKIRYSQNILFGVALGSLNLLSWFIFAIFARKCKHPRPYTPLLVILYVFAASLFELFEVPNGTFFRLIDAHSLWHLATIPTAHWNYVFLLSDFDYLHINIHNIQDNNNKLKS